MADIYDNLRDLGIELKGNSRNQKVKCPNCKKIGKTNWKDTCLSVNLNKYLYNCHKCSWKGYFGTEDSNHKKTEIIEYSLPKKNNITKLTDEGVKFFENRRITQAVLVKNKIAMNSAKDAVVFPYFENGVFTNSKTRFIAKKDFRQSAGAKPIMFNYDRIKSAKEIIICEGEIDSMSWEVAGIEWHTSVNQGAPNENDQNVDKKLECVTNSYDAFEQCELIYIAVDNDANGRRLEKELIRRFGAEKCKIIDYSPFKDANEYLVNEGSIGLKKLIESSKDVKIEGIFEVDDVRSSMKDSFINGKRRGTTTYFPEIDEAWTHRTGEVSVWTGYENEGKSTFLNQILVIKAAFEGWKTAVFTPENFPLDDFFDELVEMYIGKTTDRHFQSWIMSNEEHDLGLDFVNNHFFAIYPKQDFKLESIFERTKYLVKKKGVRSLIIDPYNTIEHFQRSGEREELYISRFMAILKRFAIENDISIHLVAHQNSAKVNPDTQRFNRPWSSNIKGGAVFAQKADNVLFVQRPDLNVDRKSTEVLFGSLKIKKQKLVGIPQDISQIQYDRKSNRYFINGVNPLTKIDCKREGKEYELKPEEPKVIPMLSPEEAFGDDDKLDKIPF